MCAVPSSSFLDDWGDITIVLVITWPHSAAKFSPGSVPRTHLSSLDANQEPRQIQLPQKKKQKLGVESIRPLVPRSLEIIEKEMEIFTCRITIIWLGKSIRSSTAPHFTGGYPSLQERRRLRAPLQNTLVKLRDFRKSNQESYDPYRSTKSPDLLVILW